MKKNKSIDRTKRGLTVFVLSTSLLIVPTILIIVVGGLFTYKGSLTFSSLASLGYIFNYILAPLLGLITAMASSYYFSASNQTTHRSYFKMVLAITTITLFTVIIVVTLGSLLMYHY